MTSCPNCFRNYTTLTNINKSEYHCLACNNQFYLKYTNLNNPESKIRTLEQILNKLSYDIYDLKYIENSNKIVKQFYTYTNGKGLTKIERDNILINS